MILQMFAVKDQGTDQFGNPMFLVSAGQAIRSFGDEVNRSAEDNMIFKHADDFDLYELGTFDTASGQFVSKVPERIASGRVLRISK